MLDDSQFGLVLALVAMALINAASLIWAFYLEAKLRRQPTPKIYQVQMDDTKALSEIDMKVVQQHAQTQLQTAIDHATEKLEKSLGNTTDQIAGHMSDTVTTTLSQEFEKYHVSLEALREETIQEFSKLQQELEARRSQLQEQLDQVVVKEYKRRTDQFNDRLSDVVASYLAEALGSKVDLGAQTPYILETLEQHKEDIKRDVLA